MKNKKICYLLPFFDLNTDSHYYHLYGFIDKVAENRDVFLVIEKGQSDISYFKNVKHIYIQKFSLLPLRIMENFFIALKARLTGYEKFYIHYSYISAINASIICRLTGGKTWYWNCGMMWLFKKDVFNQFMLKATFHLINFLVTGAEVLKDGYAENYSIPKEKIMIMPNWIDQCRFNKKFNRDEILKKFNLEENKKYILFVHRLAERKGANYIAKIARNFDKDTIFLVAGDGPYRENLIKDIEEYKLINVKLLGKISNALVPELMSISDVFLMPSEEEGFPRVLIEAMASGLPYVASDIGGVREISPKIEQKYVYPVGNTEKFTSGIKDILSSGKEPFFSKSLKSKSEEFSQALIINKFLNILNG